VTSSPRRDGSCRIVNVEWQLHLDGTAGFQLGPYDRGHGLIIDPVIVYNTYLSNATRPAVSDARGRAMD